MMLSMSAQYQDFRIGFEKPMQVDIYVGIK